MCKFIKDILFPLNVLGKKKQCFKIDLPSGYSPVDVYIEWTGERIDVSYTRIWIPPRQYGRAQQMRETFVDANEREDVVRVGRGSSPHEKVSCDAIYLNCTNVTYLFVNGEILIGE